MFLAATYKSRCDVIGTFAPCFGATPPVRRHQVMKQLANRWAQLHAGNWPTKVGRKILTNCDKHDARTKLANAKISSVEQMPIGPISKRLQLLGNFLTIVNEYSIKQSANIFQHDGLRTGFINHPNRLGKQVSLIIGTKLLSCFGKWGAWNASGDQINGLEWPGIKLSQVPFDDIPMRPIKSQGATGWRLPLNQSLMVEARPLQTQRLSSGPGTQFK